MNIGILTIATGKYQQFIVPLYKSIAKNFLANHEKTFILFTDEPDSIRKEIEDLGVNCRVIKIRRMGFPGDTLYRYHHFASARDLLVSMKDSCPDALYYFDADMLVSSRVGEEVLPTKEKPLIATAHPGYYQRQGHNPMGTPETDSRSTACIPGNRYRPCYWAGGFNGGEFEAFMKMSKEISERVDLDTSNNIVAVWHDESHLNAYLSEPQNLENVKTLVPSYCYPESWSLPFEKKILALDKDHAKVRN